MNIPLAIYPNQSYIDRHFSYKKTFNKWHNPKNKTYLFTATVSLRSCPFVIAHDGRFLDYDSPELQTDRILSTKTLREARGKSWDKVHIYEKHMGMFESEKEMVLLMSFSYKYLVQNMTHTYHNLSAHQKMKVAHLIDHEKSFKGPFSWT